MKVYREDILDSKVVEEILGTIPMKLDYVVTAINESHDTKTLSIADIQGNIESDVNIIFEKTKKVKEDILKSDVNLNNVVESSQTEEGKSHDNINNGGIGNFRG